MNDDKNTQLFLYLINSFQMQAMIQLGKLTNPVTQKTERELEAAQVTIDMLDMLKAKTKDNVGIDEKKFLDQVILDLKLNYVEERDKDKSKTEVTGDKDKSGAKSSEPKEKTESDKGSEGVKNSGSDDKKEKPLTEQNKDYEDPVPPQE